MQVLDFPVAHDCALNPKPLRVLILEDNPDDALLMMRQLSRSGFEPTSKVVQTKAEYLAQLDASWDVILADYCLPNFDALRALEELKKRRLDIPFIVITGAMGDEAAARCLKLGAADYLLKDRLARVGPAVLQALEQQQLRTENRRAEEALRKTNDALERRVAERTAELQKTNDELQREITERKELERQVLEISESERRRIGQDLHDDLCSLLTGISFKTQVLEEKLSSEYPAKASSAGEIAALLQEAIMLTRGLARGLHPVNLEANGIISALKDLAWNTESTFQVNCRFCCNGRVSIDDNATAAHVYHIAQETIQNAIKHGNAKHLSIYLSVSNGDGLLEILDDGGGLTKRALESTGMGLNLMRYRARMIGGSFEIQPRKRGGTLVTCSFRTGNGPVYPSSMDGHTRGAEDEGSHITSE